MELVVGRDRNQDPEITGLYSDNLYMLSLRGLEATCQWTQTETWAAMNDQTELIPAGDGQPFTTSMPEEI